MEAQDIAPADASAVAGFAARFHSAVDQDAPPSATRDVVVDTMVAAAAAEWQEPVEPVELVAPAAAEAGCPMAVGGIRDGEGSSGESSSEEEEDKTDGEETTSSASEKEDASSDNTSVLERIHRKVVAAEEAAQAEAAQAEAEDAAGSTGGQLRSKNEVLLSDLPPEEPVGDLALPAEAGVEKIGIISAIIDCLVIVQAQEGCPAIDQGSVLWSSDRLAIGRVFETFGPVLSPLYSIRFNTPAEVQQAGLEKGAEVFYAPTAQDYTIFVLTAELAKMKGSDSSGRHDEPLPSDEEEFSDDEKEAARKQAKRNARKSRQQQGTRDGAGGPGAGKPSAAAASRPNRPQSRPAATHPARQHQPVSVPMSLRQHTQPQQQPQQQHHHQPQAAWQPHGGVGGPPVMMHPGAAMPPMLRPGGSGFGQTAGPMAPFPYGGMGPGPMAFQPPGAVPRPPHGMHFSPPGMAPQLFQPQHPRPPQ